MRVGHVAPNARDFDAADPARMVDAVLGLANHPGIAQFRVGTVTTTILDTAVPVTFASELPDTNYAVFIQTDTNVSVVVYPSALTTTGFTLNLSVGVSATFSYLAVGVPE